MPDMRLRFTEKPSMTGVFRLPLPLGQWGPRTDQEIAQERATLGDTDMMHTFDPRYVPERYATTLRTMMHRHSSPCIYVISGCRDLKGDAERLPAIQAINFRAPFDRFMRIDTRRSSRGWPPQTAAHIQAYHDGLLPVARACERAMQRRAQS